ncbi:MAG: type II toxin-antitoxin system RelE/ParE family toxin [Eubacterium sp.]|nr:type II toxin-antitoxin system RelE/ParE family toxin [Eubacterium sp.]
MSYQIYYSDKARNDLRSIYEYITYELLVPDTAANQIRSITQAARSLEEMPLRYSVYDAQPWKSIGIRTITVGNYLLFYLVSEKEKTVNIVRIIYGARNLEMQITE